MYITYTYMYTALLSNLIKIGKFVFVKFNYKNV